MNIPFDDEDEGRRLREKAEEEEWLYDEEWQEEDERLRSMYPSEERHRSDSVYRLKLSGGKLAFVEWDYDKNQQNMSKHYVPFELARHIFKDENRLRRYDEEHSENEDRWNIIGKADPMMGQPHHKGGDMLFVVYAEYVYEEIGLTYRLISARNADKEEVMMYEYYRRGR